MITSNLVVYVLNDIGRHERILLVLLL